MIKCFGRSLTRNINDTSDNLGWGLGYGYQKTGKGQAFWQWGDNGSFKGLLIGYPERKEGLVFFANSYNGLSAAKDILSLFFNDEQPFLDWLDYEKYSDASFKLLHRCLSLSFEDAVKPFLKERTNYLDTTILNEQSITKVCDRLTGLKKYEAVKKLYEMNLHSYPSSPVSYNGIGIADMRMGNYNESAEAFLEAYRLDPKNELAKNIGNKLLGIQSPDDKKPGEKSVTFNLKEYPDAKNVNLAGSFNGWNNLSMPMRWINGEWIITINLKPATYTYKFVVDGVWIPDPKNPNVKTDFNIDSIIEILP